MKDVIVIIISALAGLTLFGLIMCLFQLVFWAAEYLLLINNSTHKWVRQYNAMNGKWYWAKVERSRGLMKLPFYKTSKIVETQKGNFI